MTRASRIFTGVASILLIASTALAADPAPAGVTSGPAAGTNAMPNGTAQKRHMKHVKKAGSDSQSLGLSAGAVGAGAPGVAGKPGGESDVGHTSAPGTPNPHQ